VAQGKGIAVDYNGAFSLAAWQAPAYPGSPGLEGMCVIFKQRDPFCRLALPARSVAWLLYEFPAGIAGLSFLPGFLPGPLPG
jgi:hypothetical protein